MSDLVKPTIHLNGSGRENLENQYEAAWHALTVAIDALRDTAPHMRDYYPQSDDKQTLARNQHLHRLERLEAVKDELERLLTYVKYGEE